MKREKIFPLIVAGMLFAEQSWGGVASLEVSSNDIIGANDYAAGKIANGEALVFDGAVVNIAGGSYNSEGVSSNRLGVVAGGDLLGSGSEQTSLTYTGEVSMSMSDGKMASLWGGSILGGNGLFNAQGGVSINVTGGSLDYSVMGGSMSGKDGQTSGQGSDNSSSIITGGVNVSVSGTAQVGANPISIRNMLANGLYAGSVYGGGIMANNSSESVDYTNVSLSGNATVNGFVFGGGSSFANGSFEITGASGRQFSTQVTISENANIAGGYVFGGAASAYNVSSSYSRINGDTFVSIDGGKIEGSDGKGYVFGGSYVTGAYDSGTMADSVISGSTNVRISGGTNANTDVYGGGYAYQSDDSSSGGSNMLISGNSNVSMEGGTVKNIYGGSLVEEGCGQAMSGVTKGGASITVTGGTILGDIYGGGSGISSVVDSGTVITFAGDSSNINFSGTVYGGGADGAVVNGKKSLAFGGESNAFTGTFSGNIADIDELCISSKSNVNFANAFDVEILLVDADASVFLADGTKFDVLTVLYNDECGMGDELDIALSDIFGDCTTIVESAISSKECNFTITNADGEEFYAFLSENGHIEIGAAVPEPAAYAAIFGALSMALAVLRRRK